MNQPAHPATFIPAAVADTLRTQSAAAEAQGSLTPQQLAVIYEHQLFNLWVPKAYGGLELPLPEALRIEEGLAWADGSAGWTITLCSGANWFAGYLPAHVAATLFHQHTCFAGSGKPSGIANITADGFEVTGQWDYATGAPHATVFTANCKIAKEGVVQLDENGQPIYTAFWFYKEEVTIRHNWHTTGMIATASEGFAIHQLQVPRERSFTITPATATSANPVFHFPFLQFAEATLAVNYAGMAMHFIDGCRPLFEKKELQTSPRITTPIKLMAKLADATTQLQAARAAFYETTDAAWREMTTHQTVREPLLTAISDTSRTLASLARETVDRLYPYCGLAAADPATEINRVWRDLHTATQHALLTFY